MASYEKVLPREQWHQVLMNVPAGDLCNVALASRHMNSVASWPDLWVGVNVNKAKVRDNGLAEFYSIKRFRKITKMDLSRMGFTGEEINRILSDIPGSPLKELDLSIVNFSFVPGELLARALAPLQSVNLWFTHLSTDQSIRVLEACRLSSTLTNINLMHVILNEVPAEILSSGISRLHTVNLEGTNLTNDQSLKVVKSILSSHTLVNVNLSQVCLNQVPAELLSSAIPRLVTIHLYNTRLTTSQCVQLLESMLSSNTLVSVDLGYVDLSGVPSSLLARATSQLETAKLWGSNLTTEQCSAVLEAILSSTTLVNVNLQQVNLSGVQAVPLARAVCKLMSVSLEDTSMTMEQCIQVVDAISSSGSLRKVDLTGNELARKLPADLLASLPEYVIYEDVSDDESSGHKSTDEISEMDETDGADTESNDDNDDDSICNALDETREKDGSKEANSETVNAEHNTEVNETHSKP